MPLLLDTHVFLWFISGDARLAAKARVAIQDARTEVFLSVVSVWEAIVKYQLGKLSLPQSSGTYLPAQRERHGIASLELDETSVAMLHILPSIYRDPFDRIMICHTLSGALTLVTTDAIVKAYSVPTLDG